MDLIGSLVNFGKGLINEGALRTQVSEAMADDDTEEFEQDEVFMQECAEDCLPYIVQAMLLGESVGELVGDGSKIDAKVNEACDTLRTYFIGQGLLSEAAAPNPNNKKITYVRFNREARIAQLKAIITLKMARKKNHPAYKKFKIGQMIRKKNYAILVAAFGKKAEKLARKLWQKMAKSPKTAAVIAEKKAA